MINDIIQWILKKINAFIDFIVFWREWDYVSMYFFIGTILLIILFIFLLRKHLQQLPKKPQNMKW